MTLMLKYDPQSSTVRLVCRACDLAGRLRIVVNHLEEHTATRRMMDTIERDLARLADDITLDLLKRK